MCVCVINLGLGLENRSHLHLVIQKYLLIPYFERTGNNLLCLEFLKAHTDYSVALNLNKASIQRRLLYRLQFFFTICEFGENNFYKKYRLLLKLEKNINQWRTSKKIRLCLIQISKSKHSLLIDFVESSKKRAFVLCGFQTCNVKLVYLTKLSFETLLKKIFLIKKFIPRT